ncbi:nitroreductase family protein [Candidatus Woesearchaeota archaeon]|nr:nitroreductase family protein [Candidatus Woesearchaeota archaeon]
MEVLDCIKTRRSIRKYLDKAVAGDDLHKILEAGQYAPSSGNLQNWKFIVVLDKAVKKKIAEAALQQYWIEAAPVLIVVCAETKKAERYYGIRGERLYSIQNCAAAVENMLITANSIGLGSCWISAFEEDAVVRILGIPEKDDIRPQAIITIGYADETPEQPKRFTIETITYFNKWRGVMKDVPAYFQYWGESVRKNLQPKAEDIIEKIKKRIKKK